MTERTSRSIASLIHAGALSVGDGYRTKRSELAQNGYRIVRVADVADGAIRLDSQDFVSADFDRAIGAKAGQVGDVLLTTKGTVGRVVIVPTINERIVYSPQLCYFRVHDFEAIDPRYLGYWFRSVEFINQASHRMNNTDMAAYINLADIRSLTLELPSLAEQRAIAEVLGALDDKIAANTKLANTVDDYLAALLLSQLESDYETTPLGAIARVNGSVVKPKLGGKLRYVDIASVSVGHHEFPEETDWAEAPGRARRGLARGDVMWSTVRPNRRSHSLNLSDDPLLVASTGLAILSPETVGFAYLYEVTKLPEFTSYLENVAEGSAYPAVRADRFADAPVPLLPTAALEAFERMAAPMREYNHSLSEESRTLAATRDALLPQLMSGKLRVKDSIAITEQSL